MIAIVAIFIGLHTSAATPRDTIQVPIRRGDSLIVVIPRDTVVVHDTVTKTVVRTDTVYRPTPPPAVPPAPLPSGAAEVPRRSVDTTMPVQTGTTWSVSTSAQLQAALNASQYGDAIELQNGVTFVGNFILPYKPPPIGAQSWIVLRPATGLPTAGTRMTPQLAASAKLPIIQGTWQLGAIQTTPGAHHYRLVGIEVSVPASISNSGLVRLGSGSEATFSELAHDLVLDRLYIHGTPTGSVTRCVALNSASTAIIDSWISDCHTKGSDAQAIAGWGGPGPYLISNNYLEGSGENISFGGVDPLIQGLIPSDITIVGNHLTKPVSWLGGVWTVKNLFELKNAQRVLVEGNVLENNWNDAQGGSAINLKSTNQSGGCPWCGTQDVTVRWNWIRNTGSGFNLSAQPDSTSSCTCSAVHLRRISIVSNLVTSIGATPFTGDGRGFLINGDVADLFVASNTIVAPPNSAITFGGPMNQPALRFTFRDNVSGGGLYGIKGPGLAGPATLAQLAPGALFTGNVLSYSSTIGYPAGNQYPATFVLQSSFTSPFVGVGVDIAALNKKLAGVVLGP